MAHGIGAIKAGGLAPFAERFCRASFAAVVFDYRESRRSSGKGPGAIHRRGQRVTGGIRLPHGRLHQGRPDGITGRDAFARLAGASTGRQGR